MIYEPSTMNLINNHLHIINNIITFAAPQNTPGAMLNT